MKMFKSNENLKKRIQFMTIKEHPSIVTVLKGQEFHIQYHLGIQPNESNCKKKQCASLKRKAFKRSVKEKHTNKITVTTAA
jgi:hypothetical protein